MTLVFGFLLLLVAILAYNERGALCEALETATIPDHPERAEAILRIGSCGGPGEVHDRIKFYARLSMFLVALGAAVFTLGGYVRLFLSLAGLGCIVNSIASFIIYVDHYELARCFDRGCDTEDTEDEDRVVQEIARRGGRAAVGEMVGIAFRQSVTFALVGLFLLVIAIRWKL